MAKEIENAESNASSTADIAFMLLIFFLITTSMDTDRGLARRLPPPPENDRRKMTLSLRNVTFFRFVLIRTKSLQWLVENGSILRLREKARILSLIRMMIRICRKNMQSICLSSVT